MSIFCVRPNRPGAIVLDPRSGSAPRSAPQSPEFLWGWHCWSHGTLGILWSYDSLLVPMTFPMISRFPYDVLCSLWFPCLFPMKNTSIVFPYYFMIISLLCSYFPSVSFLFPYCVPTMSLLSSYYFPIITISCPYYLPNMFLSRSLLFPKYSHIISPNIFLVLSLVFT